MIILFYGQPGSGKTTLADELFLRLNHTVRYSAEYMADFKFIRIDGDKWRSITKNKDYSKEGRLFNLKGAFDMALYLEKEGYLPILSFVSPYQELRQYLKENSNLYVGINLEYQSDRDKNQYFAEDFENTEDYNLKINTTYRSVDDCVDEVIMYCGKIYK
jgi:adenylylsulfate kinase